MVPLAAAPLIPYSMELTCFEFAASAVKVTWIVLFCPVAVADTLAGGSGGAAACTAGADWADGPARFVAETVYSYHELSLSTVNDVLVTPPLTVLLSTGLPHGPESD